MGHNPLASFEARREGQRAPLAITAKPLRGDDGIEWWARRKSAFAHPTLRRTRRGIQEEVTMFELIKGGV
jgi:hypothetical protein